ncbi:DEAD/DEAH box helicase [Polyangium sp. 15x6]|uniref:DEAD/DEAH box helicase n=1 Tax=Polyangium sp. 15x6 TaxID=3042687 RepID=UPI00249BB967|nr:DEAD/DEAH box helicase [Polyangium sp. 15x6]MDI3288334.1 DEAD/DEAH box helicase [Polyangium sp. 15x6]
MRLNEGVRRWIWEQRWTELRDLQERAIEPILSANKDVILSAATASGKTEAAFFPICTHVLGEPASGVRVLAVSPLKALINDQYRRLTDLCDRLGLAVHRWHGDVSQDKKRRLLADPSGVLIITPESLEALFVVHGSHIPRLFGSLSFVVVDELHAFIGSERGRQLQSLLHRVERAIRRRVPRVALSATLGDMELAAEYLRTAGGTSVERIVSQQGGAELKLQVRGYRTKEPDPEALDAAEDAHAIAEHIFKTLRGSTNLIFANRRSDVEQFADLLARRCEQERLPVEFFAHHGSLAKELRENAEARLRDETRPANVVCTSTLEMGIDIGQVQSVAQIGAPVSVSSLRQRLGRSGRKGGPAVLRMYVREPEVTERTPPQDMIRAELVQAIAMVNLLVRDRWCEPPAVGALHLSTLIQQVLSLIAERGGASAVSAHQTLCETGPFTGIPRSTFATLLRVMGSHDLVVQSSDGTLLHGRVGERIVGHFSFFTAFHTPEEWRLVSGSKTLGTLPIDYPVLEGMFLIFAGKRWRITGIDEERKVLDLVQAKGGKVPSWSGVGGLVHDRVRQEMLAVYQSVEVPIYLDTRARDLLEEGRTNFVRLGLYERALLECAGDTVLFAWVGDRVMNTLVAQLVARRLEAVRDGVAITIPGARPERIREELRAMADAGPADAVALARTVRNKYAEKYDGFLGEELLALDYSRRSMDVEGAFRTAVRLARGM